MLGADEATEGGALLDALDAWLAGVLGEPGLELRDLRRLAGGSSRENWSVDAVTGDVVRPLLVRRDPPASVAETDRAVEVGVLRALAGTGVPAPEVVAADLDGSRLGRPAVVLERASGRADRALLRSRDPLGLGADGQRAVATEIADLLAAVHAVPVERFAGVLGGVPSDPAACEIRRWEAEIERVRLEPQPELVQAATWLWEHRPPPPSRPTLVHGDVRPANVLVTSGARATLLLDWEFTHLGDPTEDLGWYCAPIYRLEHCIAGTWEERDFLARYAARAGLTQAAVEPAAELRFWQVLALFKLGAIALAGVRSFVDGETDRATGPADALLRTVLAATLSGPGPAVRPTPAEVLAGIATILRTTIAPTVDDAHARSQLHQIIIVLTQLEVDDPVGDLRREDADLRALLGSCRAWREDDQRRSDQVNRPTITESEDDSFEALAGAHHANRAALERFILELRSWRHDHGIDDSHDLDAAITAHLSGGDGRPTP